MKKYKSVIDVLTEAKEKINTLLKNPEDDNHRLAITHRLQMDIDKMSLLHGIGVDDTRPVIMPDAKTIGGKAIERTQKISLKDTEPDSDQVKILKAYVEEAYATFTKTDSVEILKNSDPLVIRGVAKKAGMNKVTKDNPEKITLEFIDSIKDLIRKK